MRWLILAAFLAPPLRAQDPTIFAPGVISGSANERSPVFASDCRTVWYSISNGTESVIATSHLDHDRWTQPTVAEFSGRWRDLEASMAPDGSYLIFASNRPSEEGGAPIDGNYSGTIRKGRGLNLWRVNRSGRGWSAPVRLSETVNGTSVVFSPSIVADGSLYFMKASPETGRFQIYRSQWTAGQYAPAERVSFSEEQWNDFDPAVAPDESFAVFSSNRPPAAGNDQALFIVFRRNGAWGEPTSLGPRVNGPDDETEPRLAPDGHTLFFSSDRIVPTPPGTPIALDRIRSWNNGLNHIWRADLATLLPSAEHRGCTVR